MSGALDPFFARVHVHDDRPAELRALTGLRFIAAAAVVVFHFLRDAVPGSWPIARELAASGFTAVSLFFVLSGFVLAYSYQRAPLEGRSAVFAFLAPYAALLVGLSLAVHHAVEEPARKWLRAFRVAKTAA